MTARRDILKAAGLLAVEAGLWPGLPLRWLAAGDEATPRGSGNTIGRREIVLGLDGLSRVADAGNDPFTDGHGAAAVIAAAFFCQENKLDGATQKAILSLIEGRLLGRSIYAPRPDEPADPKLVDGLVQDLDDGIDTLRRSGHNIIFAVATLKALREVPEAATPERVKGLRTMVRSFGAGKAPGISEPDKTAFADLDDEKKFVRFVFDEYLAALDLFLAGKGHHGFAGHVLTVGHALLGLARMGHTETARKGLAAYRQFLRQARAGADLGGRKVEGPPPRSHSPLDRDYWVEQGKRSTGSIVSSHLVKYPYSFYALLPDLADDELKQRALQVIYHLTAVS